MLHYEEPGIQKLLLSGSIGLEKEGLRITGDGFFAKTPHPFPGDPFIVRDFCENQTEINTQPKPSPQEAVEELCCHVRRIKQRLAELPEPEYLWPFSNPPYIHNEKDIPIAQYYGAEAEKTEYREYLSDRYGRYKMTFSGIHFNYSFSDELLRADFSLSGKDDFQDYKNDLYSSVAGYAQLYNWLVVAITAASPLLDSSYWEKETFGKDVYNGMGSSRCSELGYWNFFTPVLDYSDISCYSNSIRLYIEAGLIRSSSEMYFPVRLKPPGKYSLAGLITQGVSHIELRMIDLNPFCEAGVDERDVRFLQLLLVYLACLPKQEMDVQKQIQSIANTKNAARFDLKTVHVTNEQGVTQSVVHAATETLRAMQDFFCDFADKEVMDVLEFELEKFADRECRYAWKVRERFTGGFVEKGLAYIKEGG